MQQIGAQRLRASAESDSPVSSASNGHTTLREDAAGVHTPIHLHDRDAGFGIAGKDGGLNRRRAPPAWEQ